MTGHARQVIAGGFLAAVLITTSASAGVVVAYTPPELPPGQVVEVTVRLVATTGDAFDLGGVIWSFGASPDLAVLDFRWESGLDGPNWFAVDTLPKPQVVWAGGIGGGPVVSDAAGLLVATLTVSAGACGGGTLGGVTLEVFESTGFATVPVTGGWPPTFAPYGGLESVSGIGGRYLAIRPAQGDVGVALLVTSADWGCLSKYVDAQGRLVASPVFQTGQQWGTTIVGGVDVVPLSRYSVQVDCGVLSSAVEVTTWRWGDTTGEDVVNLEDLLCQLDRFAGLPVSCGLFASDLLEATPDGVVNLSDVLAVQDAFAGLPYPGPTPCE